MNAGCLMGNNMSDPHEVTNEHEAQLAEIADDYASLIRSGQRPNIEDFVRRLPGAEHVVRDVLKSIDLMHHLQYDRAASPAECITTSTPERIGEYEILHEAGRGGMGVIYRARQIPLNRIVALKVLPVAASLDPVKLRRFRIETQSASMLHNPHIIAVYGSGSDHGTHYFAMQFIEGYSLDRYIHGVARHAASRYAPSSTQRGAAAVTRNSPSPGPRLDRNLRTDDTTGLLVLPPAQLELHQIVAIVRDTALALQHAHECGILHRDIKPSNLMIDRQGKLWVTDFGLAHMDDDATLTKTGDIVGTLRYMSPEQAIGGSVTVDHRCDIYSLGATLFELLTLQPMIDGDDRATILRQLTLMESPRPRKTHPQISRDLETIVIKATAKSREHRYSTAAEFAADLQRFLDDRPILARRPGPLQVLTQGIRRNRATTAALCLLPLAVVVASVWNSILVSKEKQRVVEALSVARSNEQMAVSEAKKAKQISHVLQQLLASANPNQLKGAEYTVRQLLDDLSAEVFDEMETDPDVTASLRATIGNAYRASGSPQRALPHLVAVLDWNSQAHAHDDLLIAGSLLDLAWVYSANAEHDLAVQAARESVERYSNVERRKVDTHVAQDASRRPAGGTLSGADLDERQYGLLQARWCLQHCLIYQGTHAEADATGYESIQLAKSLPQPPAVLPNMMHDLAQSKFLQQDYTEAERLAKESVELHTRLHGPAHPETGWGLHVLAKAYQGQQKHEAAADAFRRALTIFETNYSSKHNSVRVTTQLLCQVLRQMNRTEDVSQLQSHVYGELLQDILIPPDDSIGSLLDQLIERDQALAAGALVIMAPDCFKSCDQCLLAMNILALYETQRQSMLAAQAPSLGTQRISQPELAHAPDWTRTMRQLLTRAADTCPDDANYLNVVAWDLAVSTELELQQAQRAVELAKRAVTLAPESAQYAKTLALAHLRNHEDELALEMLARSSTLAGGGDEYDDLFHCLTYQR